MVTGSKKSETAAPKKKTEARPKSTTTKAKAAAPKAAAKSKTTAKAKAAAPKAAVKAKTTGAVKAPVMGRKVGEMFYNDELLESLAEMVLRSSDSDVAGALPEIKKQLFDYDIYMVSFLRDGEVSEIAANVAGLQKIDTKDLTDRLLAVRECAKVFVGIAGKHNSVRAYIDKAIEAEGREAGINQIKVAFLTGEYCIRDVDSATCATFLAIF